VHQRLLHYANFHRVQYTLDKFKEQSNPMSRLYRCFTKQLGLWCHDSIHHPDLWPFSSTSFMVLLLHPNPVFCQLSHECMSQPDRDVIWLNRGKFSNDSNISTLKDLSIDLCME
jgi:hypothetical protein